MTGQARVLREPHRTPSARGRHGRRSARHLISHPGSTTLLLERILDLPLTVRVLRQDVRPAERLRTDLRESLGLTPSARVIVRHSELRTPDGVPVSRNTVVSDVLTPSEIARVLTDPTTPLGRSRLLRGGEQERCPVSFGRSPWDDGGRRQAMWRSYLIRLRAAPPIYVEERFNPDLVSES
ncbi:chorismate--pyruvate lyase family protein [Nocardiopsis lucentensis]|uniref:chorismate--pyruvate lyase family protein n=1 Tax=Nocardiopsis lucentensis TaxID=53441 RepID=UPI00034A4E3C|nr:hypothetical protein [Nocardiopsis lucentensis]